MTCKVAANHQNFTGYLQGILSMHPHHRLMTRRAAFIADIGNTPHPEPRLRHARGPRWGVAAWRRDGFMPTRQRRQAEICGPTGLQDVLAVADVHRAPILAVN